MPRNPLLRGLQFRALTTQISQTQPQAQPQAPRIIQWSWSTHPSNTRCKHRTGSYTLLQTLFGNQVLVSSSSSAFGAHLVYPQDRTHTHTHNHPQDPVSYYHLDTDPSSPTPPYTLPRGSGMQLRWGCRGYVPVDDLESTYRVSEVVVNENEVEKKEEGAKR